MPSLSQSPTIVNRCGCGLRAAFVLGLALSLPHAVLAVPPPAKLALTGARIISVVGKEIPKGTLLIERGKIVAAGAKVEIPFDAVEVDLSGRVLFPGMIDPHSARGLDVSNESLAVTPFVDVYDAIDPSRLFFEDSLRDGVTTVHVIPGNNCVIGGVSRVVRPIGLTPDEMTVRERVALKLSTSPKRGFGRLRQMETLRETFAELDDYLERLAEKKYEEKLKAEERTIDVSPEEARKRGRKLIQDADLDDKHRNLVKLRDGRLTAWIYCGAAMDVAPAIQIAKDNGFLERTVFVLGADAVRAADELKAAGRPVVLAPELTLRRHDPLTGAIQETFVPEPIHAAGLEFALQPSPDTSLAERYLNYQAARLVRRGMARSTALRSITITPAKLLGMEKQLGSLEAGKTANVVVFSGDPLDFNSWVEKVYIDGVLAYERKKDVRLQELIAEKDPAADAGRGKKSTGEDGNKGSKEKEKGKKSDEKAKDEPEKDPEKDPEEKPEKDPEKDPEKEPEEKPEKEQDRDGSDPEVPQGKAGPR